MYVNVRKLYVINIICLLYNSYFLLIIIDIFSSSTLKFLGQNLCITYVFMNQEFYREDNIKYIVVEYLEETYFLSEIQ
jgi:hypothetical protein